MQSWLHCFYTQHVLFSLPLHRVFQLMFSSTTFSWNVICLRSKRALPRQDTGEQKGSRDHKGTYQRQEGNPEHEGPSSSLSSMARVIRHTTESQFLHFFLRQFIPRLLRLISCCFVWLSGLRLIHYCSGPGKGWHVECRRKWKQIKYVLYNNTAVFLFHQNGF